jgi:uncharacterized protein YcnI
MKHSFLALLLFFSNPALAHVTANPDNGAAGKYFETAFRVSHGCEGSDTIAISIKLPKGMITAKPQFKPGWTVEIKKSKLDKSVPAGHGKMANEQIDEIIWRGGKLPDAQYDTFGILMKLPERAGETLWFPVTQSCEKGELNWIEIPTKDQQWHDLKYPAPFVKINSAPISSHAHH